MPRSLVRAGFEVSLLAPAGSLAEKSRSVMRTFPLADHATMEQWIAAFATSVKATRPALVVPCDDAAFRLLQRLADTPAAGSTEFAELIALIRHSLGDPAGYRCSVEKTLLPPVAERLGVRMPGFIVAASPWAAAAFAKDCGYPIVVKRDHSSAGDRVRTCRSDAELFAAMTELGRPHPSDFAGVSRNMLIQKFIPGVIKNYTVTAWRGRVLTSYAGQKLEMNPPRVGPSTVTRYHRADDLLRFAEAIVHGLDISGFLSLECLIAADTGLAYLIEINRRLVPGVHRGGEWGVDHCAAIFAAMHGLPLPTRATMDPGEEHLSVHFPQEWLRDPRSDWLAEHSVDVPWDDPELIEAMLAMRHED